MNDRLASANTGADRPEPVVERFVDLTFECRLRSVI